MNHVFSLSLTTGRSTNNDAGTTGSPGPCPPSPKTTRVVGKDKEIPRPCEREKKPVFPDRLVVKTTLQQATPEIPYRVRRDELDSHGGELQEERMSRRWCSWSRLGSAKMPPRTDLTKERNKDHFRVMTAEQAAVDARISPRKLEIVVKSQVCHLGRVTRKGVHRCPEGWVFDNVPRERS
jgi:hypothetical protein